MAIFGNRNLNELDVPTIESGYGAEVNGNMDALIESFDDDLAIIEAMHDVDMKEMQGKAEIEKMKENDADDEDVEKAEKELEKVTEAGIKDIFAKIVEKLQKLWAKIKAWFASIRKFFDGIFMSAEDFVKKYENQLRSLVSAGKLKDYKYKMYNYTNTDVVKVDAPEVKVDDFTNGSAEEIKKELAELKENEEKFLDGIRGLCCGETSVSSEDFQKKLFAYYRDGAEDDSDKKEITVDIDKIIAFTKNGKAKLNELDKRRTTLDKIFTKYVGDVNKMASVAEKNTEDNDKKSAIVQAANYIVTQCGKQQNIFQTSINAWRTAVNEQLNTYKSVCLGAFRYKKEN